MWRSRRSQYWTLQQLKLDKLMNVKVEVGDVHLHNLREKELSMTLFVNNLSGRLTLMCAGYLCCWVRNNKRFLIYTKFPSFKYSCKKVKKKQKWCLCGVGEMVDITLEQNCYIWCGMEVGTPVFASEQRNPLYRHMRAGLAYLLQISVRQIWGKLCQFANIKVLTMLPPSVAVKLGSVQIDCFYIGQSEQ